MDKMARTKGSNGDRLDKHDVEIAKLQREAQESKAKFDEHLRMHVKQDLVEKRFTGSDKFLYTYDDIAEKHNINRNVVQKIAETENLTRRNSGNLKLVGDK